MSSRIIICENPSTGEKYTLKCYMKSNPKEVSNVMSERSKQVHEVLKSIDSKYLMKYIDRYEDEDYVIMVFKYYEGIDLFQYINEQHPSEQQCRSFFVSLLNGLKELHSHNIIHLDIKPENMIVSKDSDEQLYLIIIDFDKSVVNDKEMLATLSDVDCIGSVPYASPEVLKHESFDFSTDIWSAGITFFTMLTGQNLFLLSYPKQILTRLQMVELTSEFFIKKYNLSRLSARILENILCIEPNMRMTIDELLRSRWLKQ